MSRRDIVKDIHGGAMTVAAAEALLDQPTSNGISYDEAKALREFLGKRGGLAPRCWCGALAIPGDNVCHFHNPS